MPTRCVAAAIVIAISISWITVIKSQEVETFPLNDFGPAFAQVRIGARIAHLVIDSGSSLTVVDERFASQLGSEARVIAMRAPTGAINARFLKCDNILLGNSNLRLSEVGCFDFGKEFEGEGVDGVLGMDVIAKYHVDLDWDRHEVRMSRSRPLTSESSGQIVRMRFQDNHAPIVDGSVDGVKWSEHLVDTGASISISLLAAEDAKIVNESERRSLIERSVFAGGDVQSCSIRLPHFLLSNTRFKDVICELSPPPCSQRRLGIDLFRFHRTILSFPWAEIELLPRVSQVPNEANMSGIHLFRIDGRTIISLVDKRTPSADAGLAKGDELLSVNGNPAANLSPAQIRGILRERDGAKVAVRVRRNGVEKDFEFVLRKQI